MIFNSILRIFEIMSVYVRYDENSILLDPIFDFFYFISSTVNIFKNCGLHKFLLNPDSKPDSPFACNNSDPNNRYTLQLNFLHFPLTLGNFGHEHHNEIRIGQPSQNSTVIFADDCKTMVMRAKYFNRAFLDNFSRDENNYKESNHASILIIVPENKQIFLEQISSKLSQICGNSISGSIIMFNKHTDEPLSIKQPEILVGGKVVADGIIERINYNYWERGSKLPFYERSNDFSSFTRNFLEITEDLIPPAQPIEFVSQILLDSPALETSTLVSNEASVLNVSTIIEYPVSNQKDELLTQSTLEDFQLNEEDDSANEKLLLKDKLLKEEIESSVSSQKYELTTQPKLDKPPKEEYGILLREKYKKYLFPFALTLFLTGVIATIVWINLAHIEIQNILIFHWSPIIAGGALAFILILSRALFFNNPNRIVQNLVFNQQLVQ
jgi:hypothetical protein